MSGLLAAVAISAGGAARAQGALKPGAGQATVQRLCATCHTLDNVTRRPHTADEWDAILGRMIDKGLIATDGQLDDVAAYLTKNYGPGAPRAVAAAPAGAPAKKTR
ncbi:c-type cytochrome [Phenylobacterium sp.]|uniref:c-type cytochrome n=1 Tax=Phenylobacterium sp. TaxID=1871053 RepID=UPI003BAC9130